MSMQGGGDCGAYSGGGDAPASANFATEFEEYVTIGRGLPKSISDEDKLIAYGLYKQATVGPVNTSRPATDTAKWDAWKAVEGKSKEEAMSDYVTKVKQLKEKYSG